MNGFLVRARKIQVHVLDNFCLNHIRIRCSERLGAKIDLYYAATGIRRRERFYGVADPTHGRLGKIKVAIDTVDDALATKCSQPLINFLADGAEFRIGRVAQRQHAEFDTVEPASSLPHSYLYTCTML